MSRLQNTIANANKHKPAVGIALFAAMFTIAYALPAYESAISGLVFLTGFMIYLLTQKPINFKKPAGTDGWLLWPLTICAYAYCISIVAHAPKNVSSTISTATLYVFYALIGSMLVLTIYSMYRIGRQAKQRAAQQ
jgi:uncharacterized membrane protein YjjB (DUF3815 family)